jgi:hypothetical protein
MIREISIFSGSEDLCEALGLLWRTATAATRGRSNALPLDTLAVALGCDAGLSRLTALAERLGVAFEPPPAPVVTQLFADEQLSRRALKHHQGRNVYSATKLALWNHLWAPFIDALVVDAESLARMTRWVACPSWAAAPEQSLMVAALEADLQAQGFEIERHERSGCAPLLLARREARGQRGHLALYGHYDTETPDVEHWRTQPLVGSEADGRLFGLGLGDNKAPLAFRLAWLARQPTSPAITWVLQGEEEVGSPLAHDLMDQVLAPERESGQVDLWLDENGYFDLDGTQRLLARTIGALPDESLPPDPALASLLGALTADAAQFGLGTRLEVRGLNKSFFPRGCPFNRAIPPGARALAIGVNDPASQIHAPDESVPLWTFPIHGRQLGTLFAWLDAQSNTP